MAAPKHTIILLVRNRPGVLTRIASLFRRRLINIESLAVGHCETPGMSRMTIGVDGENVVMDQIIRQIQKLVDVVKVMDVTSETTVQHELAMIMVECSPERRHELVALADIYKSQIVDVGPDAMVIETVGEESKVDSLITLLEPYGIREIVRTGRVAMVRVSAAAEGGQRRLLRAIGA
ncbi:MAG: acetolactate synthase small subunit [Dehalococcoidia bacterium]|nr:MAG: acetolactate synthase small subunit [Dehalococcoidia bacterium]